MPPFRVALIGYGLAGSAFHAPFIAAEPELTLAAIVTRDEGRRGQARQAHPAAELLDSADEIWERSGDFDLVVVASPDRFHVPQATAAVEVGLGVVVDKPFAPSSAEARALIEAARRRGALLTVFQNRRWDGDFLTVRRLLAAGELGEITRFESRFDRWRPQVGESWRELGDPEGTGGVLFDLGSHLVDQALQLFGPARSVYAEVDRRRPGARVEDDAFIALTHESGVRSHLGMSLVAAQPAPRIRLLGTGGAYVKHGEDVQEAALREGRAPGGEGWGTEPEEAWGLLDAGDAVRRVPTEPGAYQDFYRGVVAGLRDGAPPPVDPRDAVSALEVLEAARLSSAEGRIVELA
jgi:scyllo-inositol 2-dehydrogenase (NADP+)